MKICQSYHHERNTGAATTAVAICRDFQSCSIQQTNANSAENIVHDGIPVIKALFDADRNSYNHTKFTVNINPHAKPPTNLSAANISQDTE